MALERLIELKNQFGLDEVTPLVKQYIRELEYLRENSKLHYSKYEAIAIYKVKASLLEERGLKNDRGTFKSYE